MSETFTGLGDVKLSIDDPKLLSKEELDEKIAEFKPQGGWVNAQSEVFVLEKGDPSPRTIDPARGALLAAELCADNATLAIRHIATPDGGAWQVTQLDEGHGPDYRFDDYVYLTVNHGHMRYRRYWQMAADGLRPFACRFIGFEDAPS